MKPFERYGQIPQQISIYQCTPPSHATKWYSVAGDYKNIRLDLCRDCYEPDAIAIGEILSKSLGLILYSPIGTAKEPDFRGELTGLRVIDSDDGYFIQGDFTNHERGLCFGMIKKNAIDIAQILSAHFKVPWRLACETFGDSSETTLTESTSVEKQSKKP